MPDVAEELQGHLVQPHAERDSRRDAGDPHTAHDDGRANRPQLKYWLRRDVSADVRWCVLETGKTGGDVASVYFKRPLT